MKPTRGAVLNRREFLKVSAVAGLGLSLGIYLTGCEPTPEPVALDTATPVPTDTATLAPTDTAQPAASPQPTVAVEPTVEAVPAGVFEPNIYLAVDDSGAVTIRAFRSELGQGIRTAIAMILAEELDADWAAVRIEQAPTDRAYGDQVTGGSVSVSQYYDLLRFAGATARHMLVGAAAQAWGVEPGACRTESGWVIHPDGEQQLSYGQVIASGAEMQVPAREEVQLKAPKDFRLIGKPRLLYDAPAMADGSAIYASDVRLPGMLYAVVARCPVFEGKVTSYDDARARAVPGVRGVVPISSGLAVVADSTWAALQGRAVLDIIWDEGSNARLSSETILQQLASLAPQPGSAREGAMDAVYDIPYLAHATMEPMVCVADARTDRCELWAPSQAPQAARDLAMSTTKLPADAVVVHVPLVGGGFGRRHYNDFAGEAVQISIAVGAPTKLIWTREDDIQHDRYHAMSHTYVSAELDETGRPASLPRVRRYPMSVGVPTGYWRSVENFPEAFARESFLDEIASSKGLDPLELRLSLVPERARPVLELAAEKAGWGSPVPEAWGRGLAYWATFGVTHVAQVAEVSVDGDGSVRVHRVVCAVDCGTVVNPDTVVAQMEGGIVFGLTAALKAEITVESGRVQQSNFHDYPLLRMDEMPEIEVHIVPSDQSPRGVGEMGVPPIAPAVANAVYAATGKRIRRLPIRAEDLR